MNELREVRAAVVAAGFDISVNQAGPLLEQMARDYGDIRILTDNAGRFNVEWSGAYGVADSILEAAMRCVAMYGGKRCRAAEFGCECGRKDDELCPLPHPNALLSAIEPKNRFLTVASALYASEINCGIEAFWDGGWSAWLGDQMNGRRCEEMNFDTFDEIADWLHEKALVHYPTSVYAKSATTDGGSHS